MLCIANALSILTRIKCKLLCMWNIFIKLTMGLIMDYTLQWRHDERNGVSNHQCPDCLLNRLFRRRSKNTSKLCVTGLYAGNSPVTPHKELVTRKMFLFNDVIMQIITTTTSAPPPHTIRKTSHPTPYYQLILATKLIIYVFISYILVFALLLQAVNTEPIYSTSVSRVPLCRHGVPSD